MPSRVSLMMGHAVSLFIAFVFALLLPFHSTAQERQVCAVTIKELQDLLGERSFPLQWEETSMDDGKPLVVSILEKNGNLYLEFVKSGVGLWVESVGVICKVGGGFEARFSAEQVRLGPAANWVLRYALSGGGTFTLTKLGATQLRITTSGWSGNFSPVARSQ